MSSFTRCLDRALPDSLSALGQGRPNVPVSYASVPTLFYDYTLASSQHNPQQEPQTGRSPHATPL